MVPVEPQRLLFLGGGGALQQCPAARALLDCKAMPSKDFLERTDAGGAFSLHREAILSYGIHHKEEECSRLVNR